MSLGRIDKSIFILVIGLQHELVHLKSTSKIGRVRSLVGGGDATLYIAIAKLRIRLMGKGVKYIDDLST